MTGVTRGKRIGGLAFLIAVSAGLCGTSVSGSDATTGRAVSGICPTKAVMNEVLDLGNVYFGETHGTNESPAFVGCLVRSAVGRHISPLYVSFELPPVAADTHGRVWSGMDGRTSEAYAKLVDELQVLEKQGKLVIDYQLVAIGDDDETSNRLVGEHLKALSAKGRIIAIGGSMHAQRRQAIIPSFTFKPAGAYTGPGIKSILLDSSGLGQAWMCVGTCEARPVTGFTGASSPFTLNDGTAVGFDYVLTFPPATASRPHLPLQPP
ncbi:hypothetical protein SAMN02800692_2654 [Luteibacter sp. UNC138MFCol5.1]|nr:hypothetical protein SAMN02800692_2654 [Luteibacter sp. UNC138MFCol5.1]